ncbi:RNA polymerase sigma-70 factor [Sphingobacterium chuzhouense]|uniref:RNA polymerase sigma-70 factor n=1 Tax=Sphingobacterium chuzhouense TaxID=1742264 RepID=A0ABR7XTE5_9SPHI|nr:RNA polymerase sigma-70 factor [Sphingobacterium chuzhouense]MBD1422406.1 RNA polymerase sigma-70 factor [Sphingobacterium chuzhouense]
MTEVSPYTDYSDEVLIDLLKKDDSKAFSTIYDRYASLMYQFAYNILQDEEECTDVIQDIFVWFWTNRRHLKISKLKGYLIAAVKYRVLRIISTSRRREAILNTVPFQEVLLIEDPLEIKELKLIIAEFVNTLPPKAQKIFRLSREQYKTNKEIATEMNISEKTVENHMTSILKKLRTYLGKNSFLIFLM